MSRSVGCRVWDEHGREYVDLVMALGSVALGYAHPAVTAAVTEAAANGVVSGLPPSLEEEVAELICTAIPWVEQVRFLKTGAEAVAAAVRIARAVTGRDRVFGCGYHGWLDWCQPTETRGVPAGLAGLFSELPFNEPEATRDLIRAHAGTLAAVVVEPVIAHSPDPEWLRVVQTECERAGIVFVLDEIKTVGRLAVGGAAERWGIRPDLVVMGKAIANGLPLAVVGGRAEVMAGASQTWISSTLATETVSLAAARATLATLVSEGVPAHLSHIGTRLLGGLRQLAERHPVHLRGAAGLPEMCFLQFTSEQASMATAQAAAMRGLLFKRTAYNFVSLAHGEWEIDFALGVLGEVLEEVTVSP
jgi:glutamate-1-semialdehyde 2,1-aminomutase